MIHLTIRGNSFLKIHSDFTIPLCIFRFGQNKDLKNTHKLG